MLKTGSVAAAVWWVNPDAIQKGQGNSDTLAVILHQFTKDREARTYW